MRCVGIIYSNSNLTDSHFSCVSCTFFLLFHAESPHCVRNGDDERRRAKHRRRPKVFLRRITLLFPFRSSFCLSFARKTIRIPLFWPTLRSMADDDNNTKLKNPVYKDERKALWTSPFVRNIHYALTLHEIVIRRNKCRPSGKQSTRRVVPRCGSPIYQCAHCSEDVLVRVCVCRCRPSQSRNIMHYVFLFQLLTFIAQMIFSPIASSKKRLPFGGHAGRANRKLICVLCSPFPQRYVFHSHPGHNVCPAFILCGECRLNYTSRHRQLNEMVCFNPL